MKNLLVILIMLLSFNSFSQIDIKAKTVLSKFILGFDTEKTLKEKIDMNGLNSYDFDDVNKITRITLDEYFYKQRAVKVVLLLVNNDLYGVKYYPKNENTYQKYLNLLDKNYNRLNVQGSDYESWFNSYIEIFYELDPTDINGNFDEYFIHYDSELLKKYPQYKTF